MVGPGGGGVAAHPRPLFLGPSPQQYPAGWCQHLVSNKIAYTLAQHPHMPCERGRVGREASLHVLFAPGMVARAGTRSSQGKNNTRSVQRHGQNHSPIQDAEARRWWLLAPKQDSYAEGGKYPIKCSATDWPVVQVARTILRIDCGKVLQHGGSTRSQCVGQSACQPRLREYSTTSNQSLWDMQCL